MRATACALWRWCSLTVLAVRAFDAWRAPPLKLVAHAKCRTSSMRTRSTRADWEAWMKAEDAAFAEVRTRVTGKLPAEDRIAANRFFGEQPDEPAATSPRTGTARRCSMPDGRAARRRRAAARAHGFSVQPAPRREHYRDARLRRGGDPHAGHGTVPAGLTQRAIGKTGWRRPGSPCGTRACSRAKRRRCISSATRTAARWR